MRSIKLLFAVAVAGGILFSGSVAYGQESGESQKSFDKYVELLRSDISTQKVALYTEALDLNDQEGSVFWPIYREYENELAAISDRWVAGIKDYAANFENMTDEKANELAEAALKMDEERAKLRRKYFRKFEKELGGITAAKWVQLERIVANLIQLQVQSEVPLIP